jgi:RimJ/RimL family protein N-acetyltransferase
VTIRNTVEADLDTILALIEQQKSVNTVNVSMYHDHVAGGMYRDAWNWVVEEDGKIQALAIWWGRPGDEHPYSIDGLYFAGDGDPVPAWTALIREAIEGRPNEIEQPEYHIFLAAGWRDDPETVAELEPRSQAAAAAGLTAITDRLRYDWRPEYGLPERSTRLRFEPADDEAFVDVFARVSDGSLDAATARDVARLGREGAARADLEGYKSMPGDRSWWRLAYDANNELVGFAMPSANAGGPVVGYVGVVPEHRGHGYVDDLLAEITHQLADTGAERIRSDTDFGNVPMAKSFERLGYRIFAVRRVLSFPETAAN